MTDWRFKDWVVSLLASDGTPVDVLVATSVTIPSPTANFDTDARAGKPGIVYHFQNIGEMEASMTLRAMSTEFRNALLNSIVGTVSLQLTAVGYDSTDETNIITRVVTIRGRPMAYPVGAEYNAQQTVEYEVTIACNYLKDQIGTSIFEYDPENYIWSVDGVNKFAAIKTALGI